MVTMNQHDHGDGCEHQMPPGRYWVGDLCYVLGDAWSEAWQYGDGVHSLADGRRIAKFHTIHGDGIYSDDHGNEYGVDSGSLGCILADDIRDTSASTELGVFVTVSDPFNSRREYPPGRSTRCDGGILHLCGLRIELDEQADDNGHDHDDGELCPGCQFKAELAESLEWANGHSEEAWLDLTGELTMLMGTALSMLTALRMSHVKGAEAPHNTAAAAAAAISRLGGVIDETWHIVMDDDSDIDD